MSTEFFLAFMSSALFAIAAYLYGKWETEVKTDINAYRHFLASILEESMAQEKEDSKKVEKIHKVIEWIRNGLI